MDNINENLKEKLEEYKNNPIKFIEENFNIKLFSYQEKIIEELCKGKNIYFYLF